MRALFWWCWDKLAAGFYYFLIAFAIFFFGGLVLTWLGIIPNIFLQAGR